MIHAVEDNADAIFTWGYDKGERAKLDKLYEKAKTSQWNATTDLPWDTEVDLEKMVRDQNFAMSGSHELAPPFDLTDTPLKSGRQGVPRVRHRDAEPPAQPVHAR